MVAIGEAGLDYHYDNSPRDAQEQGFRAHIAAARETGLPLVIHAREADDDVAKILREETGKGAFPAVLHCFTGGRDLAFTGIELGLYVSFTGILTYKKTDELRAIAKDLPADRILVETDSPYLAPGKFRGKRCEPAYVAETARVLAETRGVSPDDIARQTTENFFRLFSKVPRPSAGADKLAQSAKFKGPHDPPLHHSRLRLLHGRAAAGAGLGRLRPEQPEKPPAADLASGRAARAQRPAPGSWSTPRRTSASSCSTPTSNGSTAC